MRLPLGTVAEALEDEGCSPPEFGTGLRARLDVVRSVEVAPLPAPRRDVSPELMLVSPEPTGMDGVLGELLAKRVGHCVENGYRCESCRGTMRSGESLSSPVPSPLVGEG